MNALFKNQTKMTFAVKRDSLKLTRNNTINILIIIVFLAAITVTLIDISDKNYSSAALFGIIALASIYLYFNIWGILAKIILSKYKSASHKFNRTFNETSPLEDEIIYDISVYEEHISWSERVDNSSYLTRTEPHNEITVGYKTKVIYAIFYDDRLPIFIDRNTFSLGSEQAFEDFFYKKGIVFKQK